MRDWIKELNELSLRGFSQLFERLALDETAVLEGVYRGTYVGPGWLRKAAPPAMRASGLGGWWGKLFESGGPEQGVIDSNHEVFGYPGLFVTDAAAIPANVGVNPSLTIAAMAERALSRFEENLVNGYRAPF